MLKDEILSGLTFYSCKIEGGFWCLSPNKAPPPTSVLGTAQTWLLMPPLAKKIVFRGSLLRHLLGEVIEFIAGFVLLKELGAFCTGILWGLSQN